MPTRMNFGDDAEQTLETINTIHEQIVFGDAAEVFLEHRHVECISPDAALVLISELHRCLKYSSSRRVKGDYPENPNVAKMLIDIGFYKFLNIKAPTQRAREGGRVYIKVSAGNRSEGQVANNLLAQFEKAIKFDPISRRRLYSSLLECMDNVRAHAYLDESNTPDLIGEWWMAGFCDPQTGQVAFVFYDQGVGIPTTLRQKPSVRIRGLLDWSESKMISNAVRHGVTRTGSIRHGKGLPSLRDFIDELTPSGYLRVMSGYGDFLYGKHCRPQENNLKTPLKGSLIVWSIQPDQTVIGPDGIIDLSRESAQLRLGL